MNRAHLVEGEVRREQAHRVLGRVLGDRVVRIVAEARDRLEGVGLALRRLARELEEVFLAQVGRVAVQALRLEVVELLPAGDGLDDLAFPGICRRDEGLQRLHGLAVLLLLLPLLGRERLDVIQDPPELFVGDVPRQHRRAVKAVPDEVLQVLVVRQLVAGAHARELEDAEREVTRRRAEAVRRRSVPIPLVAVARVAVPRVRLIAEVEVVPGDRDAARHGGGEGVHLPFGERHLVGRAGGGEQRGSSGHDREYEVREARSSAFGFEGAVHRGLYPLSVARPRATPA